MTWQRIRFWWSACCKDMTWSKELRKSVLQILVSKALFFYLTWRDVKQLFAWLILLGNRFIFKKNTKYFSCYIFTIPPSKTQLSVNSYSLFFQMAQDSLQCAGQVCDPLLGLSEGRDPGSAAGGQRWGQHRRCHCVWDPAAGRGCIWGRTLSKCWSLWKHIIKCFPLEPCSCFPIFFFNQSKFKQVWLSSY